MLITADPQAVRQEAESMIEEVVRFVVLRSLSHLTAPPQDGGTPVDTGFASASWICSVGVPSSKVAGERVDVDYGPQELGQLEVLGYRLQQGSVFLVNNVWYLPKLNRGSSVQARAQFVEAAYQRALNEADAKFR